MLCEQENWLADNFSKEKFCLFPDNINTSNRTSKENDASAYGVVMIYVTKHFTSLQVEICDELKAFDFFVYAQ